MNSRIANFIQEFGKTIIPLIPKDNFCLMKWQLQNLKASQQKVKGRIENYMSSGFNQASKQYILWHYFPSFFSQAVTLLILKSNSFLIAQQLQLFKESQ